ncbi:MAG: SIMPL domain-containing protein [Candidatus Nealsonbacteria bacterium]|nr:SIMPL domain-containing protein [Candidatus Nealsonbacteria bacterium]
MFENNKIEMCCGKMHKPVTVIFFVLVCLTLVVLIAYLSASTQYKAKLINNVEIKNIITVSGIGEVYTKPDLAVVNFSVVNEAITVDKAVSDNAGKINSVIKAIKEQGVKEEDLKTTNFYIYPRYEYRAAETEIYSVAPQKRVLVGYEITQSLEVKIRDLSKIGLIIETGTTNGANEVGDLQMKVDKEDEFKSQARASAIAKAKELAKQVGVKLGKITNFSEDYTYPVYYGSTDAMSKSAEGIGGGAPDIQTGQNKITSTVSITYEIE